MKLRNKVIVAVAMFAAAAAGTSVAVAGSGDEEHETPITGPAYDKASAAALAHTGGGRVTDTEAGDEESYYEVEVRRNDGSQVDVQLDENFQVVGSEADDDSSETTD
jgi:uncharacterized membrane protein YkoI